MKNNVHNIVILHGWGLSGSTYKNLKSILESNHYHVFAPDLPGFGKQPLITSNMDLGDYVEFVRKFIKEKQLSKVILIGHSFGGRVALKYAWKYPKKVSQLILTGVPIIRHNTLPKDIAFFTSVIGGAFLKKFPFQVQRTLRKSLYFIIGEWDYYNAGSLKEMFKNIINEDLAQYTQEIKVPVLLLWGKNDRVTPFNDAVRIQNMIENSKLVVIENTTHKLPYENPKMFVQHASIFLNLP